MQSQAEAATAPKPEGSPPVWRVSPGLAPYAAAVAAMESHVAEMIEGRAGELAWLLEHPPLYTAGSTAKPDDLLEPTRFPVHRTGRGGEYTYHGPGQRVCYVMLDLNRRGRDVRAYVASLEEWLIKTLAQFGVSGARREGRVGIWVELARWGGRQGEEAKIAAIGVRLRRWISFHGVALNVHPNLDHFGGIVPCGIRAHGVTSLAALGISPSMREVDRALRSAFEEVFGPTG